MPNMELRQDFFLGASSGEAGLPSSGLTVAWAFSFPCRTRPSVAPTSCAPLFGASSRKHLSDGDAPLRRAPPQDAFPFLREKQCASANSPPAEMPPYLRRMPSKGELLRASEEPAVTLAASFFSSSRRRALMRSFADTSRTLGEALSADFPGRPAGAAGAAGFAGEAGTAGAAGTP